MCKYISNHIIWFLLLAFLANNKSHCQKSYGGIPLSLEKNIKAKRQLKSTSEKGVIKLPYIDNKKARERTDSLNISSCQYNFYYAQIINTNINIKDTASFYELEEGNLWLLKIESPSAYGLQFHFGTYKLPEGAKLYIYNKEKTMILGAFTSKNYAPGNEFVTQHIKGNTIFIEYFEPADTLNGELSINGIGHIYRNLFTGHLKSTDRGCYKDAACLDSDWDKERKAVCMIETFSFSTGDIGICTGVLVNKTQYDGEPILLTASHCYEKNDKKVSEPQFWVFVFHKEKSSCGGDEMLTTKSVTGCDVIVQSKNYEVDIMMARLKANKYDLADYGVAYAGWNAWDYSPGHSVPPMINISHPEGLSKKYAKENNNSENFGKYFNIQFDEGTAYQGSSGSPLFNKKNEVIGILSGSKGDSPANPCDDPDHEILFGKLHEAWAEEPDVYKDVLAFNSATIWPKTSTMEARQPITDLDVNLSIAKVDGETPERGGSLTAWSDVEATQIKFEAEVTNGTPPYSFIWNVYNNSPDDFSKTGTPTQDAELRTNKNTHVTKNFSFDVAGNYLVNVFVQDYFGNVFEKDFTFMLESGSPCIVSQILNTECAKQYEFAKGSYISLEELSYGSNSTECWIGDHKKCKYPGKIIWSLDGNVVDESKFNLEFGYQVDDASDPQSGIYHNDNTGCFHLDEEGTHTIKLKTICGNDPAWGETGLQLNYDLWSTTSKKIKVVDCDKTVTIHNTFGLWFKIADNDLKTGRIHFYPAENKNITIHSGKTYNLEARREIVMKPGFVAEAGSVLKASIDPCPESDCDCYWWDKNNTKSLKSLTATKDTNKKENQQLDRTHKTVRLYPNPTSDGMFIIACNNNTIPYNLKILNSTGNIIFSQEKIKTRQKQLSIASFPTGVYLVHISSGKFIKTSKIIYQ